MDIPTDRWFYIDDWTFLFDNPGSVRIYGNRYENGVAKEKWCGFKEELAIRFDLSRIRIGVPIEPPKVSLGSALPDNWPDIHREATSRLREMEARGEFTEEFFKDYWGWMGHKHPKDNRTTCGVTVPKQIRIVTC